MIGPPPNRLAARAGNNLRRWRSGRSEQPLWKARHRIYRRGARLGQADRLSSARARHERLTTATYETEGSGGRISTPQRFGLFPSPADKELAWGLLLVPKPTVPGGPPPGKLLCGLLEANRCRRSGASYRVYPPATPKSQAALLNAAENRSRASCPLRSIVIPLNNGRSRTSPTA